MQHAQDAGLEVLERAGHGADRAVEAERDRVDRHVAAAQVVLERRRLDVGQRARRGVALAPRAHEVVAAGPDDDEHRAEAIVGRHRAAEARGRVVDVALGDEVDLPRDALEEQVADRPADEMDAVSGPEAVERPRAAGQRAQRVEGLGGGAHAPHCGRYPRRHVLEPPPPALAAVGRARGRVPRRGGRCRGRGGRHEPTGRRLQSRRRVHRGAAPGDHADHRRAFRGRGRPPPGRRLPVAGLWLHEGAHEVPAARRRAAPAVRRAVGDDRAASCSSSRPSCAGARCTCSRTTARCTRSRG